MGQHHPDSSEAVAAAAVVSPMFTTIAAVIINWVQEELVVHIILPIVGPREVTQAIAPTPQARLSHISIGMAVLEVILT